MKKFVSILLAAAVLLCLSAEALAASVGDVQVTDAYTDSWTVNGLALEFHIPAVSIPGADMTAFNDSLYSELYDDISNAIRETKEYGYPQTSGGITYGWSVQGNALSLLVQDLADPDSNNGGDPYTVYNLSAVTGRALSLDDLLLQCGYSRDNYLAAVKNAVRTGFRTIFQDVYNGGSNDAIAQADDARAQSVLPENLAQAEPFVRNGHLCIVCGIYTMAGSGYDYYLFDLNEGDTMTYAPWTGEDAPESPDMAPVTDAFVYTFDDDAGGGTFRIPTVNLPGAEALNADIWQDIYVDQIEQYDYIDTIEEGLSAVTRNIYYNWAVNGDILSILVTIESDMNDLVDYFVYNASMTDGRRLSDSELLENQGLSRDQFYQLAEAALVTKFNDLYGSFAFDEAFKAEQLAMTRSAQNVQTVMPYLNGSGYLCVIGRIYSLAGAEYYFYPVTLPSSDALVSATAVPATAVPATAVPATAAPAQPSGSSRLIWFIEHSDTQYFSESDIAGFTEEMCNYARNGVYARSGRGFLDQKLQDYFLQFDWYSPDIAPDQFTDAYLNDYQIKNIALVLAYEQAHGYI